MHILLLTHYFPPEVNAPANRGSEHAKHWCELGHQVTVVTCAPSHPHGRLYPGYKNRWFKTDSFGGTTVIRLGTWLSANNGTIGRTLSFLSYFFAVFLWQWRLPKADVVVSTSPQFFCGLAGWLLQRRNRPWVLEIRDLWPDSIIAVGAMKRGLGIRMIETIEHFAYRRADLVVSVTDSFVPHIAKYRGDKPIVVVRNGVVPGSFICDPHDVAMFKDNHGLTGRFVAAFVGTHGMAHALDTMIEAAVLLRARSDIALLLVGDGAERDRLLSKKAALALDNLVMLEQQPRSAIPVIWGATGAALVLLRKSPTFRSVLPTKMFEAMAASRPVILGAEGEAKAMLEAAGAGIAIEPENAAKLAQAITTLADDYALAEQYGASGLRYFEQNLDRRRLAEKMLDAMLVLKA